MDNQRILQQGEFVQWYRIEELLGRGGFGVTYLATDTNLDHKVAIKEYMPGWAVERMDDNSLHARSDTLKRDFDQGVTNFLREARTLVKFRHPNIVRVMTVFEANNTAYLVMEYEEGEEFKSYVHRGKGMDEASLKRLILKIADGLDQVHQYGFLHRDIKPVNLIIRKDGTPVLLDFGAARPTDSEGSAHTAFVSAGYTPIEQYQEGKGMELGPWTDIYSLGATIYYAITGNTPVGPTGRLAALVRKSPDPLSPAREVGAGRYTNQFLDAIDAALRFNPQDRPQNLSQWREMLEEDLTDTQPLTGPLGDPEIIKHRVEHQRRELRSRKRSTWRWVGVAASIVACAFAGSWLYNSSQDRAEVRTMSATAASHFERGEYVSGAVPLYRQVLARDPQNSSAKAQLQRIENNYRTRINAQIESGDLLTAGAGLDELEETGLNNSYVASARGRLAKKQSDLAFMRARQERFEKAQKQAESGQHKLAIETVTSLLADDGGNEKFAAFKKQQQEALDDKVKTQQAEQKAQQEKQKQQAAQQKRIAEANKRQRQKRSQYNLYLKNAEEAILSERVEVARSWLDKARSLQIEDRRLRSLESQVVEMESYQRKPLSDYEISYARGQINALSRALASKNSRSIKSLSEGTPSRQWVIDELFSKYIKLETKIVDLKPSQDPKGVSAKLIIESLVRPNGDIVSIHAPTYSEFELTINRLPYGWSRIVW